MIRRRQKVSDRNEQMNSASKVSCKRKRAVIVIVLALAICIASVIAVYAAIEYANANAPQVEDTFEPAKVTCQLTSSAGVYTVTNTGNVSVYVRVYVDADWVDSSGVAHWTDPACSVTASNWTKDGNFYYYNTPVAAGGTAQITVVSGGDTAPTGYTFSAKVSAEVIQSDPVTAAQEAWGYTFGG